MNTVALIQTAGGVASVVVATVALAVAFRVERRTAARFQTQMDMTERITAASMQPALGTLTSEFTDRKAIKIINYGAGTAVVTMSEVSRNGRRARNVADLFRFERPVLWRNYWTFPDSDFYLSAGQELTLVSLTRDSVEQQHDREFADSVMASWQMQLDGIELKFSYRDIASLRSYEYHKGLKS